MLALVAAWAFAEATLFFLVADIPVSWIGLRRGTGPALAAALFAALMAASGGVAMLWATSSNPEMVHQVLVRIPGISQGMLTEAIRDWETGGGMGMLAGSFSGMPYKLYAYAAAMSGISAGALFILSAAVRLPRFAAVALLAGGIGNRLRRTFTARTLALVHVVFWVLFYVMYFAAMRVAYP